MRICLNWWVVFSPVACCAACLVFENKTQHNTQPTNLNAHAYRGHLYCTVMAVLVRITDHATQYYTLFIADYTVGTTIALLQTVLSLTALTVHPFRRLS
jgi:hypothetical protein